MVWAVFNLTPVQPMNAVSKQNLKISEYGEKFSKMSMGVFPLFYFDA